LLDADGRLRKELFSAHSSLTYPHQLASDLYSATWLKQLVWDCCVSATLRNKSWFRSYDCQYGCVEFYFLHHLTEKLFAQPLNNFFRNNVLSSFRAVHTNVPPLQKFTKARIAPTEVDNFFRNDPIQGVVHDPMAALYGGVAGNAGLFSNVNDLAVVLQMNLQDGYYGDKRYLQKGAVQSFAKKSFKDNRRGLSWDKQNVPSNASVYASEDSYGHSGFTGDRRLGRSSVRLDLCLLV